MTNTGYIDVEWYAKPNTMIGGWCVMPVDESPEYGIPEIGDFLSRELAEHIANLHNKWLREKS